ncbi:MAG: hypothetical protein M1495_01055 [Bacteroidetes bacterium]|nr:hypothetical protein [Bacteroidota bacterium]
MKLFTEGNLATSTIDQPGHSSTKHMGESRLGKLDVLHNLEPVLLKDKTNEVTLTCFCRWNVITQKSENKLTRLNKR